MTPNLTTLTDSNVKNYFVKRPKFLYLNSLDKTELLPRMLIEEAHILEFLKLHQHRNLVRYYRYTLRNGRLTGIALERFDVIL